MISDYIPRAQRARREYDCFQENIFSVLALLVLAGFVWYIVEKIPALHEEDGYVSTPLLNAVSVGDEKQVEHLLQAGADVNEGDSENVTPLMQAVMKDDMKLADFLLSRGANINSVATNGHTVLMSAAYVGNGRPVLYLLQKGVNPCAKGSSGETALSLAEGWQAQSGDAGAANVLRSWIKEHPGICP